jgi:hypothetical protein
VNVYAFVHPSSVYHHPNVYPSTVGSIGADTADPYAACIASGAVQCPFALNVILYSFAVHDHLNATFLSGIANLPSSTVTSVVVHPLNVYHTNVGAVATVTSAL